MKVEPLNTIIVRAQKITLFVWYFNSVEQFTLIKIRERFVTLYVTLYNTLNYTLFIVDVLECGL